VSNPSRRKGSGYEVELLPDIQTIWPHADRAPLKGINDWGDFTGVPLLIEAKKTDAPHFLQWAKGATKKAGQRWRIVWAGDRRRGDGPYVLMPYEAWLRLERRPVVAGRSTEEAA
jgi:hypothetical protein